MLFDFLDSLRQKTPKKKKQFAFLAATSVAGFIFIIWLSVILPSFKNKTSKKPETAASPIESLGSVLFSGVDELKESVNDAKEAFSLLNAFGTTTGTTTPTFDDQ